MVRKALGAESLREVDEVARDEVEAIVGQRIRRWRTGRVRAVFERAVDETAEGAATTGTDEGEAPSSE